MTQSINPLIPQQGRILSRCRYRILGLIAVFFIIALLLFGCSQLSTTNQFLTDQLFTVSGVITEKSQVCQNSTGNHSFKPEQRVVGDVFSLYSGNNPIGSPLRSFVTDENSSFRVELKPGSYCLIDEQVKKSLNKQGSGAKWYDRDCLIRNLEACDYTFSISNHSKIAMIRVVPCGGWCYQGAMYRDT